MRMERGEPFCTPYSMIFVYTTPDRDSSKPRPVENQIFHIQHGNLFF
jgi:hypothetical protein